MAATLELFDGSTTIDLLGANYNATLPLEIPPSPASAVYAGRGLRGVRREPRTISVDLNVKGSSVSDLRSKLRDLERMLATAQRRQSLNQGTKVVLKCQLANTDADDIEYRVMWGELELPTDALDEPALSTAFAAPGARLTLVCEPFGRLSSVSVTADTLENEQDGANLNYMDITSVSGTHAALLQLKIHDPNNGGGGAWNGSKKMWIAKRSGERRTDALLFQGEAESSFTEGTNPASTANTTFSSDGAKVDASASGGQVSRIRWRRGTVGSELLKTVWLTVGYTTFQIAGGSIPNGLYRVLVRVLVDTTVGDATGPNVVAGDMGFALGWSFGGKSKTPVDGDDVKMTLDNSYEVLDLGELVLPPVKVPDGYTAPSFDLRIHGTYEDTATANEISDTEHLDWFIDYIFLLPIDEGAAIVDSVQSSDRLLIDSLSETPGVYLLNGSDVIQKFATFTGGPLDIGPEDTRIYVLRDDTADPSTIQFRLTPSYVPQVAGL